MCLTSEDGKLTNHFYSTDTLLNSEDTDEIPHTWADQEGGGGQGVRTPPLKNHKNIGFSSNTGRIP